MSDRADHDWPDEEGGLQGAAGLRGDTGASGDIGRGQDTDPSRGTSVGATQEGGDATTPRGSEAYGDLGTATSGTAGSPETSGIKPGEESGGSQSPA